MGIESFARVEQSSWLAESPHRNYTPTRPCSRRSGRYLAFKETWDPGNWVQLGVRSQAGERLVIDECLPSYIYITIMVRVRRNRRDMCACHETSESWGLSRWQVPDPEAWSSDFSHPVSCCCSLCTTVTRSLSANADRVFSARSMSSRSVSETGSKNQDTSLKQRTHSRC